jgi:4-amino-4-deoxy-L-arabinose transferase-like glycosyltransferase
LKNHFFKLASVLFAFAIVYMLFFHRLADRDLWSSHEARAAMDAESVLEGDAFPRLFDGREEVQKPPLYYWLVAGIAWATGTPVEALAVRLPAAVSAALTVAALGWFIGRKRPLAGWLAAGLLATGIHFTWLARIGRIDMPLAFTVTIASVAFYRATRPDRPSRLLLIVGYLASALGILLKGPIGLVLPLAILTTTLLLEGRWPAFWEVRAWGRLLRELGAGWGVLLILAVVVPVYLWAERASGGRFFAEFLWHHNLERGLGESGLRSHPWWLYGPYFLLYFLPWSPLVVGAALARRWLDDPEARFGLAWLLAVVAVLSCARFKREDYLMPAYPGAALFLACVLERWRSERAGRWFLRAVPVVAGLVLLGWLVRVERTLPAEESYRDYRRFSDVVRREAPAPEEVVFFRAEAHALAFHLGRPQTTLVEWEELRRRARRQPVVVVTAPKCVHEFAENGLRTAELCWNTDFNAGRHERPLVLLRVMRE